jgi:hypothetical protein
MNSNFRYFNWRLSPEEVKEDFFVRYFVILHCLLTELPSNLIISHYIYKKINRTNLKKSQ